MGSTPSRRTSTPAEASPATTAASEELAGGAGITPDGRRNRPGLRGGPGLAENVSGSDGEVERQLGGEVAVGDPTDPVRSEQTTHEWCRDQRLLYCGALRAFLETGLLRSFTRASRVSMPPS